MDSGCLVIDPPGVMQPASIDLHLENGFKTVMPDGGFAIDPRKKPTGHHTLVSPGHYYCLSAGQLVLASTVQTIVLCNEYAARIEGKSSLGRLGLVVHSTAGFIDPGFHGQITLELSNVNDYPILLTPGMAIAQLCLFKLSSPARKPYGHPDLGSRYQGQQGPTASRSWVDYSSSSSSS